MVVMDLINHDAIGLDSSFGEGREIDTQQFFISASGWQPSTWFVFGSHSLVAT